MKKTVISYLLMIILLLSFVGANAEDDLEGTYFPTHFLKACDYNAKEWMSSEDNRALLAVSAFMDYSLQEDVPYNVLSMYNGTTFVGRDGLLLVIAYTDSSVKDQSLMILFSTSDSTQAAYVVLSMDKDNIEYLMEKACSEKCYKVDPVDLKKVNDAIWDAIGD